MAAPITPPVLVPAPPGPPPKPDKYRTLKIIALKVLVWSLIVMIFEKVLDRIGWPGWEKFSDRSANFSLKVGKEAFELSPLVLWVNLKTEKIISVKDPDHPATEDKFVRKPGILGTGETYEFVTGRQPMIAHKVTIWEKLKAYFRSFWYRAGSDNPNWFGRILLFLVLILSFFMKPAKGKSEPYLQRAFYLLIALPFIMLAFFCVFYVLTWIFGAVTALFSWIAGLGSYGRQVIKEVKSEAADHSKQTILTAAFPFLSKLHK